MPLFQRESRARARVECCISHAHGKARQRKKEREREKRGLMSRSEEDASSVRRSLNVSISRAIGVKDQALLPLFISSPFSGVER